MTTSHSRPSTPALGRVLLGRRTEPCRRPSGPRRDVSGRTDRAELRGTGGESVRKCEHKRSQYLYRGIQAGTLTSVRYSYPVTTECTACGALGVRSLSQALSLDLRILREIDAARLIANHHADGEARLSNAESYGYHLDELSPFSDFAAWHIGYLVRRAVDDDGTGWPWDPTRPVAGQFEALPYDVRTGTTRHTVPVADQHDEPMTASPAIAPDHFDDEAFDVLPDSEAR